MNTTVQATKKQTYNIGSQLAGKRILFCGKGGSGKSTLTSITANYLSKNGNKLIILDGDASNPGGLSWMIFGSANPPKPLLDFFGGRKKVTCPSDDHSILTRIEDSIPLTEKRIKLNEIPSDYYLNENDVFLFDVGKIKVPLEGCDGPMSKITRDFFVQGDYITLIDVEAGIEHYGRGIEQNVDIVLIVVDPTFESTLMAEQVTKMCHQIGVSHVWAVLNKVPTSSTEINLRVELGKRKVQVIGKVNFNSKIVENCLKGVAIINGLGFEHIKTIIQRLEMILGANDNKVKRTFNN